MKNTKSELKNLVAQINALLDSSDALMVVAFSGRGTAYLAISDDTASIANDTINEDYDYEIVSRMEVMDAREIMETE